MVDRGREDPRYPIVNEPKDWQLARKPQRPLTPGEEASGFRQDPPEIDLAGYKPANTHGPKDPVENKSGIRQLCEYKCLVLPDLVADKTEGGLWKPDTTKDREKYQTCKATFILASENAFRDWGGYRPEPGDRVYVAVASGMIHESPNGELFRIVTDKDVVGQLDE